MNDSEQNRRNRTENQVEKAKRKKELLDLAVKINNVSKACKRIGYSRQQFYVIRHNFEQYGYEGLFDRRPGAKGPHPNRVDTSTEEMILDHALMDPSCGPKTLAYHLKQNGREISPAGVRCVLERHNLQTARKRTKKLLDCVQREKLPITDQQIHIIEKYFPSFRDRHLNISFPGSVVSVGSDQISGLDGFEDLYLISATDCYSQISVCKIVGLSSPYVVTRFILDCAIPYFRRRNIIVEQIITSQGKEFRGDRGAHVFECALEEAGIEHIYTSDDDSTGSGYTKELLEVLSNSWISSISANSKICSLEELNDELEGFMNRYNRRLIGHWR